MTATIATIQVSVSPAPSSGQQATTTDSSNNSVTNTNNTTPQTTPTNTSDNSGNFSHLLVASQTQPQTPSANNNVTISTPAPINTSNDNNSLILNNKAIALLLLAQLQIPTGQTGQATNNANSTNPANSNTQLTQIVYALQNNQPLPADILQTLQKVLQMLLQLQQKNANTPTPTLPVTTATSNAPTQTKSGNNTQQDNQTNTAVIQQILPPLINALANLVQNNNTSLQNTNNNNTAAISATQTNTNSSSNILAQIATFITPQITSKVATPTAAPSNNSSSNNNSNSGVSLPASLNTNSNNILDFLQNPKVLDNVVNAVKQLINNNSTTSGTANVQATVNNQTTITTIPSSDNFSNLAANFLANFTNSKSTTANTDFANNNNINDTKTTDNTINQQNLPIMTINTHQVTDTSKPSVTTASTMPNQPVSEQVFVQIKSAIADNSNQIKIQLTPESLGKVEVQMVTNAEGKTTVTITADNRNTLAMLQNDAKSLEKSLTDIGMKTDSSGLNFNLSGQNSQQGRQNKNTKGGYTEVSAIEETDASYYGLVTTSYKLSLQQGLDINV